MYTNNKYFDIVEVDNDSLLPIYRLRIKWNMASLTKGFGYNGFIVQKVSAKDHADVHLHFPEDYYEIWEVKDGVSIHCSDGFDDEFYGFDPMFGLMEEWEGKEGAVEYFCTVYWVDKTEPEYTYLQTWKPEVWNSGNLPSMLVRNCKCSFSNVITYRSFIHEVNCKNIVAIRT